MPSDRRTGFAERELGKNNQLIPGHAKTLDDTSCTTAYDKKRTNQHLRPSPYAAVPHFEIKPDTFAVIQHYSSTMNVSELIKHLLQVPNDYYVTLNLYRPFENAITVPKLSGRTQLSAVAFNPEIREIFLLGPTIDRSPELFRSAQKIDSDQIAIVSDAFVQSIREDLHHALRLLTDIRIDLGSCLVEPHEPLFKSLAKSEEFVSNLISEYKAFISTIPRVDED
jgi:hypothetical protein